MPKCGCSILVVFLTVSLSGCGESYPEAARRYHAAAQEVLLAEKICSNAQDCQRKDILFWAGGNPWLPSHNKAYVMLYETKDAALVDAIASKLKQVRNGASMPPVKLIVYSSRHQQSKVTFREVTLE